MTKTPQAVECAEVHAGAPFDSFKRGSMHSVTVKTDRSLSQVNHVRSIKLTGDKKTGTEWQVVNGRALSCDFMLLQFSDFCSGRKVCGAV
jgi:hypothetical protein